MHRNSDPTPTPDVDLAILEDRLEDWGLRAVDADEVRALIARVEQAEAEVEHWKSMVRDDRAAAEEAVVERDEALAARDAAEEHAAATRREWDAHDTDCAELERQLDLARDERDAAERKVSAVREALAGHPVCDKYDDEDVIACGWKSAVKGVHAALADPEADR